MSSHWRAFIVSLFAVSLVAAGCSSPENDTAEGAEPDTTTTASTADPAPDTPNADPPEVYRGFALAQSLWSFDQVSTFKLDAPDEESAIVDLTPMILDELGAGTEDFQTLTGTTSFKQVESLDPELLDRDGTPRDDVTLIAGILSTPAGESLAVLGTPRDDATSPIGLDDRIRVDLTFLDGPLAPGQPIQVDVTRTFAYAVEDPAEAGLDDLDLFRHRVKEGRIAYVGEATDVGPRMHVSVGQLGMAVAGSVKAELPAGSEGLFDGMEEGLKGCKFGLKCVDNFFDETADGFKESMDDIDCMLTDGCDDDDDDDGGGGDPRKPDDDDDEDPRKPDDDGDGGPRKGGDDGGGAPERGDGSRPPANKRRGGNRPGPGIAGAPPGSSGGSPGNPGNPGSPGGTPGTPGSPGGTPGTPSSSGGPGGTPGPTPGGSPGSSGSRSGGKGSKVRGDPHLQTFDGTYYDMQAVGEFVAARSDDIEVQVRTSPMEPSTTISISTAVAVRVGSQEIVIEQGTVRIDGEIDEYASTYFGVELDEAGVWLDGGAVVIATDAGPIIRVQRQWGEAHDLWIELQPDDSSTWTGLLGDTDDDPENDYRTRDGEVLAYPIAFEDLYGRFAESWRVNEDQSLFHYAEGESTESFTDRSFPEAPFTIDSIPESERREAEMLCRLVGIEDEVALTECIIDFALTGEIAAVRGAQTSDTIERIRTGRFEVPDSPGADAGSPPTNASDAPADVTWQTVGRDFRGEDPSRVLCPRNGSAFPVWGTGEYSDDSSICTAAVHIGLITFEDGGEVLIEHSEGRESYAGSNRNGVTTESWGSWHGTFTFIGATGRPVTGKQP